MASSRTPLDGGESDTLKARTIQLDTLPWLWRGALAEIGVTWATVALPGDTRAHLVDQIADFGAKVVAQLS